MGDFLAFARKHVAVIQPVLDLVLILVGGIYVNQVPKDLSKWPNDRVDWLLIGLAVAVILVKNLLSRNVVREAKKDVIRKLLESIVRTLTLHSAEPQLEVRAFCHLYEKRSKKLNTYCAWGYRWNRDFDSSVPCDAPDSEKYVIVRAWKECGVIAANVSRDAVEGMSVPVWPDLKCVLAAAVRDYNDPHCQPLGTINFDANRTLEEVHFKGNQAEEMCRQYAASIYDLLKG